MLNWIKKIGEPAQLARDISNGRFVFEEKNSFIGNLFQRLNEFLNSCEETDLFGVCAQMAFTLLFALLPTLLFIILLCSHFIPGFESLFYSLIQLLVPHESFDYITNEINYFLSYLNKVRWVLFGLSAVMGTISAHTFLVGINQTYGFNVYNSKKWEWSKSFIVLLVFALFLGTITSIFIYVCRIAEYALQTNTTIQNLIVDQTFFYILLIVGIVIVLLAFYMFTPKKRVTIKEALPGTIFSTIGILIVFRIYVLILNRSSNYLIVYGSLSGLFVLLTAFYFVCIILNLGAKINVFCSFNNKNYRYGKIKIKSNKFD